MPRERLNISRTVSAPVRLAGTLILGALLGLSAWDCGEETAAPTTPAPAPPAPPPAPPPPPDPAGLRLSVTAATVREGATVGFGVSLTTQPNSEVRVVVTSSDPDAVQISTGAALVFTPLNWSSEQQVTLTGKQDADAVDETAVIRLDPASGDPAYRNLPDTTLNAEVKDDEVASLRVLDQSLDVREGEEVRLFFMLTAKPAADVVVAVTSSAPEVLAVSSGPVRIAADDWAERQAVVLVAQQDADGLPGEAQIRLEVRQGDPAYLAAPPVAVQVRIHDDDGAGVHLSEAELFVTEGDRVEFAVRLTAQPSAEVTVVIEAYPQYPGRLGRERLVFTPANWNVDQTVEYEALQDFDGGGNNRHDPLRVHQRRSLVWRSRGTPDNLDPRNRRRTCGLVPGDQRAPQRNRRG